VREFVNNFRQNNPKQEIVQKQQLNRKMLKNVLKKFTNFKVLKKVFFL